MHKTTLNIAYLYNATPIQFHPSQQNFSLLQAIPKYLNMPVLSCKFTIY